MDSFNSSRIPDQPNILITNSKSVAGYSYDANSYTLDIWYKGKSNSVYRYFYCYPSMVSQMFDMPGSVGKAVKSGVKGLQYQKLK